MSAYIVNEETIKALAVFAASWDRSRSLNVNPLYLRKANLIAADSGRLLDPCAQDELATFYALILYNENIRSVQYRYPNSSSNELPGPIERPDEIKIGWLDFQKPETPVVLLKLCDCLEYQSCETRDWHETAAFELLERIRRAAIHKLPGYDEAPWGY